MPLIEEIFGQVRSNEAASASDESFHDLEPGARRRELKKRSQNLEFSEFIRPYTFGGEDSWVRPVCANEKQCGFSNVSRTTIIVFMHLGGREDVYSSGLNRVNQVRRDEELRTKVPPNLCCTKLKEC